jgi:hypothetical protein
MIILIFPVELGIIEYIQKLGDYLAKMVIASNAYIFLGENKGRQ